MRVDGLTRRLSRLSRVPPLAVDVGLALAYAVVVLIERARHPPTGTATTVAATTLTLVLAATLVGRRRAPLAALLVGIAALALESFLQAATTLSPFPTLVGAYSLGLYASRARARWGPLIIVAGVLGYFASTPGLARADRVELFQTLGTWLAAWALGYSAARRRDEHDRARLAVEQRAVAEERIAISRELHDVVGHTVNLLVVQAGAARLTLDRDPAAAREILSSMEHTGRETLAELDRVVGTLRADASGPSPGLPELPALVDRFADSGVEIELRMDPDLTLPREVELAAYRIVQEGLTNTLKHAAPCSAVVIVRRDGRSIVVEVSDTGPGVRQANRHGRGLVGIAERVSMAGGVLEHGEAEGGGFALRATLPLP